jgi:hypothetical protein
VGRASAGNVYERFGTRYFLDFTGILSRESLQYLGCNAATDYVRKATAKTAEERAIASVGIASNNGRFCGVQTGLIERHARTLWKWKVEVTPC